MQLRFEIFTLVLLLILLSLFPVAAADQEPGTDISVEMIIARINPDFDFALPSGNIAQHFIENFNNLNIVFDSSINILDNSMNANIKFAYPFPHLIPSLSFFQNADFENYIVPRLQGLHFTLLPTEKFIARRRGSELNLELKLLPRFSIIPGVEVSDIFKGNLIEERVIDQGIDYTGRTVLLFSTLEQKDPETRPDSHGLLFRSSFEVRFRDTLDQPVSADHKNRLEWHANSGNLWFARNFLDAGYPLKMWRQEISDFYTLGGFDSLRGYRYGSVPCFRYLLLSTNLERSLFPGRELPLRIRKRHARLHQFRGLFLVDQLFFQDQADIESPLKYNSSIGLGCSWILSGEKSGHLRFSFYAAQAVAENTRPFIYLQTSFFRLEKAL